MLSKILRPKIPTSSELGQRFPLLGERPVIQKSHQGALALFKKLGMEFDVRRFGDSQMGLLRWKWNSVSPYQVPRRLVFVPGFGDTPLSWMGIFSGLRPFLGKEYDELILVDFPGFSGFLHDEAAFESMDEMERVFRDVLTSLQPRTLVGHSLGGWLSSSFAAENPKSLGKLVLVDPGGLVLEEQDRQTYREIFETVISGEKQNLFPHLFARKPLWFPWIADEFVGFFDSPEIQNFVRSFEDRHLVNDRVSRINIPVSLLWGDRDTITQAEWMDHWLAHLAPDLVKNAIYISGSGHSPQVERPVVLTYLLGTILLGRKPQGFGMAQKWWRIVS